MILTGFLETDPGKKIIEAITISLTLIIIVVIHHSLKVKLKQLEILLWITNFYCQLHITVPDQAMYQNRLFSPGCGMEENHHRITL